MTRDSNGEPITRDIRRDGEGWAVTVWFGDRHVTTVRRYVYRTRAQARRGDIGDDIGQRGRIA